MSRGTEIISAVPATGSTLTTRITSVRTCSRVTCASVPSRSTLMRSVPSQRYWGTLTGSSLPLGSGSGSFGTSVPPNTWLSVSSRCATTMPTQACMAMASTTRMATLVSAIRPSWRSEMGGLRAACTMAAMRQLRSRTLPMMTAARKPLESRLLRVGPPKPFCTATAARIRKTTGSAKMAARTRWPVYAWPSPGNRNDRECRQPRPRMARLVPGTIRSFDHQSLRSVSPGRNGAAVLTMVHNWGGTGGLVRLRHPRPVPILARPV